MPHSALQARSLRVVLFLAGVHLVACADATSDSNGSAGEENVEWGIGGKADGMCNAKADLCWNSRDTETMKRIMMLREDLMLSDRPTVELGALLVVVDGLGHKLTAKEKELLEDLTKTHAQLPVDAQLDALVEPFGRLNVGLLNRLSSAYLGAHLVPVGQNADQLQRADDMTEAESESEGEDGLPQGVQESLEILRQGGVLGKALATMFKLTGVLERDYPVLNAENFGEYDDARGRIILRGLSREQRVDVIVGHYSRAAAFAGAVAGTEGMIPIAGLTISIGHETYMLFELHARMAFEIAAVYGLDIKKGRNLFTLAMFLAEDSLRLLAGDIILTNVVAPIIAKKAGERLGYELGHDFAAKLTQRSLASMLDYLFKKGRQEITEAALEGGMKAVGRQLFGWVTFGLTIAASAAWDYIATEVVGYRMQGCLRGHLRDLYFEGMSYLSRPRARACVFDAFSTMMWQDGQIDDREKNLFLAYLAKPYYEDESVWYFLNETEQVRLAQRLRALETERNPESLALECLKESFGESLARHRLSVLAHLYAMMEIDYLQTQEERAYYDTLHHAIDGSGWFDGSEIDPVELEYVQRSIRVMLRPTELEVPDEYREVMGSLVIEDVLQYMAEPNAGAALAYRCGFDGQCE